jgi:transcriptional regulator with XRE-family HTH domain
MYEKYAKRRDELGLTDYKVAQMSGVLTSTLSEWKKHYETDGKSGYQPKLKKISAIASVLGMSVTDFIN